MIRNPVVAGSFYPGDSSILMKQINNYLQNAGVNNCHNEILGVISPHAGYVYSGQCAAYSFNALQKRSFKTAVIIAPSHRFGDFDFSVDDFNEYLTPLGSVKVDLNIVNELKEKYDLISTRSASSMEHSLEVQLPFLQKINPKAKIVPILLGRQNENNSKKLASILAEYFQDQLDSTVFIVSSDLSHYHTQDEAIEMDTRLLNNIKEMNSEQIVKAMKDVTIEACGIGGILVLLHIAKKLGYKNSSILDYRNSGDVSGDYKQVVGYASACIYK